MFPLQVILCLLPTIFFVFVDDFLCVFFFFFFYMDCFDHVGVYFAPHLFCYAFRSPSQWLIVLF